MSGLQSDPKKIQFPIEKEKPIGESSAPLFEINRKIQKRDFPISRKGQEEPVYPLPVTRKREALARFDDELGEIEEEIQPEISRSWLQTRVIEGDAKATIWFQNALVLIENEEFDLAKNLLRAVTSEHSHSPQAIFWLGHCFNKLNQLDEALICYQELREILGDCSSSFYLADIHYRMGQDEEAYDFYLEAMQSNDFDEDVLFEVYKNVGNIMLRKGDIDGAIENYHRAYRLNSNSDGLEVNLGTACLQKDDLESALRHFRQALNFNLENDKAWVGLALIHRQLSDFELAWANVDRALELNPENKTAVLLSVNWAKTDGKLETVLSNVQRYLERHEMDEDIILIHSQLLYAMGRNQAALLEVERAMAINPLIQGGSVLLEMIRKEKASSL